MKRFFFAALTVILFSCSGKKLPDNVLPRDKMIEVLIDIHLAEAAITTQQIYGETANQKAADYYEWVFKKQGISREQFKTSFDYYTAHPDIYKELYDELIIEMSEQEPQLKKYINDNLQNRDTLQGKMNDSLTMAKDSIAGTQLDSLKRNARRLLPAHRRTLQQK